MRSPENRLFCRLDGLSASAREQQRLMQLSEFGLLEADSVPIFEEATQTAAHFLDAPICFLGVMLQDRLLLKSAVGLSRLGLMNDLATSRQIPRMESFCANVVDSHQALAIADTITHPAFAASLLVHQYDIRAYLGVPLLTSNGQCLGTLAVMDLVPRVFTARDIGMLELVARWSMSEFERQHTGPLIPTPVPATVTPQPLPPVSLAPSQVRVELLSQLTQELRTPLTSVMGMASVLSREIYGPLTSKQKEYLDIIHNSGQYLLSLVNEILELADLNGSLSPLNLTSVDIEMLCQQAINTLEQAVSRREQQIRLTVEPGNRIWLLDKEKVRQILYHLIFSVIQSASAGSIVRLHVSRKDSGLNIAVWASHPWLGDGIPYADLYSPTSGMEPFSTIDASLYEDLLLDDPDSKAALSPAGILPRSSKNGVTEPARNDREQQELGLLLGRQLAELHGGRISAQGSTEAGYRYVVHLPQMSEFGEVL